MKSGCGTKSRRPQAGATLIELMVGLGIGMVLVAALLLLFSNASSNGHNLARAGAQIENGRYVSELMREELQLAGFYGEIALRQAIYSDPDPCETTPTGWAVTPLTLPSPITGFGADDALPCLADRKPGTHAIALRRLGTETVPASTLVAARGEFHAQVSFCNDDLPPALIVGVDPVGFTLRDRGCSAVNPVRPYISRIYYVATCRRCGERSDTEPTLKRVDLVGQQLVTTALADGIEDMRFEYGFDQDANGSPDTWLPAPAAGGPASQWSNAMAIKLHFITRSFEKVQGRALGGAQRFQLGGLGTVTTPDDGYKRHLYSATIRLVNPSGALEAQ